MIPALADVLAVLDRSRRQVINLFGREISAETRAAGLARVLLAQEIAARLYGCVLQSVPGKLSACALDSAGCVQSHWAPRLHELLNSISGSDQEAPGEGVESPGNPEWPGHLLLVNPLVQRGQAVGLLALAVPEKQAKARVMTDRAILAACADLASTYLTLEAVDHERRALADQLAEQAWLANIGELAGPVAHEFNNFLNVVLLHVAILEHEAPEKLRGDLAEIRHQARSATATVKNLQQYRRRHEPFPRPSDLHAVLLELVRALAPEPIQMDIGPTVRLDLDTPAGAVGLTLQLSSGPALVRGSPPDLRRLATFILINTANAISQVGGAITLRTEQKGARWLIRIEDTGPSLPPEALPHLFDAGGVMRDGTNPLELAACKTLVRRLEGAIYAEERSEGGLVVIVELPAAAGCCAR
jgi:signal transduction histidine kinase